MKKEIIKISFKDEPHKISGKLPILFGTGGEFRGKDLEHLFYSPDNYNVTDYNYIMNPFKKCVNKKLLLLL